MTTVLNILSSEVKKRILRAATHIHNACAETAKANKCNECPFSVRHFGCDLYGHPISWGEKIKEAKGEK